MCFLPPVRGKLDMLYLGPLLVKSIEEITFKYVHKCFRSKETFYIEPINTNEFTIKLVASKNKSGLERKPVSFTCVRNYS